MLAEAAATAADLLIGPLVDGDSQCPHTCFEYAACMAAVLASIDATFMMMGSTGVS